jgi:hypothetical protein
MAQGRKYVDGQKGIIPEKNPKILFYIVVATNVFHAFHVCGVKFKGIKRVGRGGR